MSATSQVFGSQNLSEKIFEFLPLEDRLACRNATRDITNNAVATVEPSRKAFAVRPLRESILAFLSPEDLDSSKRVKRSFNRNITEFQKARLPSLFPEEARDVVRRATFQIVALPPGWSIFGREDLCAAVVAGYFRGEPF